MAPNNLPHPNVKPFDSNINYLPLFKAEILDHASLRKWDDNLTLIFIRDYFIGSDAKHIKQVTQTQWIKTTAEIFGLLQKF